LYAQISSQINNFNLMWHIGQTRQRVSNQTFVYLIPERSKVAKGSYNLD